MCGLQGEVRSDTSLNIPLSHGPQLVSFVAVAGSGTVRLVTSVTLLFVGCTFANPSKPTYNDFRHMSFMGLPALGLPSRTLGSGVRGHGDGTHPLHHPGPHGPSKPIGSTFSAVQPLVRVHSTQTSHRHHTQHGQRSPWTRTPCPGGQEVTSLQCSQLGSWQ